MYKATIDAHARRTRTGSHSTTPDQRGRFDAMVAKAKPELMEICSLEEQEKILSERTAFTQERLAQLNKLMDGPPHTRKQAAAEKVNVLEQHNIYKARLLSIRSVRKRAANMAFCEVFREVAGFVLPDELVYRICAESNDVIMTAKRGVSDGADIHLS
jgi:hypothetical protein